MSPVSGVIDYTKDMITWLTGENSFEVREALKEIKASFNGEPEIVDGADITLAQLPNLFMGMSLFAQQRLVIVSELSQNQAVWTKLPEWLPRVNDTIHLVFVDKKPDKRTTSYKALKSASQLEEFTPWTERDTAKAEAWVAHRAKQQKIDMGRKETHHLVQRVGVDQWQLAQALHILSLLDEVTEEAIDRHIAKNLSENVFQLFEMALDGRTSDIYAVLNVLKAQEDPHRLFGLLTTQALSLAIVINAPSGVNAAKDFSVHPFVLSKLQRFSKKISKAKAATIVELFAKADADMKRSKADPWLLIEQVLLSVAQKSNA